MPKEKIKRLISRAVKSNDTTELNALLIGILTLPRPVEKLDAFLVLPGLGEDWRIQDSIKYWEDTTHARFLLIAGHNEKEKYYRDFSIPFLQRKPFYLHRTKGVIIRSTATHTREQMEWVSDQIKKLDIQSIGLIVSPYHLSRAYLTLLKTLLKQKQRIPLIPIPVAVPMDKKIPEYRMTAWEMIPGEIARITKYQEAGDVATYAELQKYLKWLSAQSLLRGDMV